MFAFLSKVGVEVSVGVGVGVGVEGDTCMWARVVTTVFHLKEIWSRDATGVWYGMG